MEDSFVKEVRKAARRHKTKPHRIVMRAGFSRQVWYQWASGETKPSFEGRYKVREAIGKLKHDTPTPP